VWDTIDRNRVVKYEIEGDGALCPRNPCVDGMIECGILDCYGCEGGGGGGK
jgi:hypothetical protein